MRDWHPSDLVMRLEYTAKTEVCTSYLESMKVIPIGVHTSGMK